jgi:exonuclease SbcD
VPTSVFDGIDYTALGHLHGRHTLTDHVRYSGSPLAYSFSEATHRKGSWLVELDDAGLATAAFVDAPVPRPLARLTGELESLLRDPSLAVHEHSWLQVTLTDEVRPSQPMERLRARFPHTLVLAFAPPTPAGTTAPRARTHGRSDHEIVLDFVADLRGAPATEAESALLLDACDGCGHDPDLDSLVTTGSGD